MRISEIEVWEFYFTGDITPLDIHLEGYFKNTFYATEATETATATRKMRENVWIGIKKKLDFRGESNFNPVILVMVISI